MKLIDADKYRDSLEESWKKCHEWHDEADTEEIRIRAEQAEITFMECILRLKDQPTVDAQPVRHGKWDYVTVVDEGFWRCSNCGTPSEALGARKLYKYCPFCGAKMDAEQEKAE